MRSQTQRIYKICLKRAMVSEYLCGSRGKVAIELTTEFRDVAPDIASIHPLCFNIMFYSVETNRTIPVVWTQSNCMNNNFVYHIQFPVAVGRYQLSIQASYDSEAVVIIPMLSDVFAVVDEISPSPAVVMLLRCHWSYDCLGGGTVVVREEFGATLGSHVWDSAIVLFRHLRYCLDKCDKPRGGVLAVELGAGCGLVGISLGKGYFERVVLTDKRSQRPYMRDNIALNECQGNVTEDYLDWSSAPDIERFTKETAEVIDLIVAADVLYDLEAAEYLFAALDQLATSNKTCILLAQKLRPVAIPERKGFDVTALEKFTAENILEEANVIIWKILKK